jgi:predicted ATPase/DNA-binding SARP family transcriptional activator
VSYLRLLGTPGLGPDGERLVLAPGKRSALLYFLACDGGWVSRDRLIGLFWPDTPDAMAKSNLRKLLSTLRSAPHALGLEIDAARVRWPIDTDLRHFRQAFADGAFDRAVELYGGELLSGFHPRDVPEFDAWLELERQELHDRWREAALGLAGNLASARGRAERVDLLARLHEADPFDEEVVRHYLGALGACGQHGRAARTFEGFRETLRRDLDREPEEATLRQFEQLRREAASAFGTAPREAAHHLPVPPTSFIGRTAEKARVAELLGDPGCRLVTITGPGGVGKTRLALEVGGPLRRRFAHGVHFVPLANATSAEHLVAAIASALGLPSASGDPRARLLDALEDQELLLILDNVEQLEAAAGFVRDALATARFVKVLATSRTPLRLYGEREYALHPFAPPPSSLPVDGSGHDALRLFVERARAVDDRFRLTAANVGDVAELCRRLDGLPLAIELAAAHSKVFPPRALVARLDDRFALLRGRAADLPPRQRTLRATIDWSYDLLDAGDQRLFRRLAVFEGGWTLPAAEAVGNRGRDLPGGALEGLARLLDHSLVYRADGADDTDDGDAPRFAMLESLRAFGLEGLRASGELEGTRHDHAAFFLALAEEAEPRLISRDRRPWLRRLRREDDDLRAVLRWSIPGRAADDTALRLVGELHWFWYFVGAVDEGRRFADEAVEGVDPSSVAAARALYTAGTFAWFAGAYGAARARLEASAAAFDRLGEVEGLAVSLRQAAVVAMFQDDLAASRALHARSVELLRQAGSAWHLAFALVLFAHLLLAEGDDEGATSCLEESRLRFEGLDDAWGVSFALHGLGLLACRHGADDVATTHLQAALAIRRAEADEGGCAEVLQLLGETALRQGGLERATALCTESLLLYRRVSDRAGIAQSLHTLGNVARLRGAPDRATRLYAAAAALWRSLAGAYPLALGTRADREHDIALARAALGESAFAAAWAAATRLGLGDAVRLAAGEQRSPSAGACQRSERSHGSGRG